MGLTALAGGVGSTRNGYGRRPQRIRRIPSAGRKGVRNALEGPKRVRRAPAVCFACARSGCGRWYPQPSLGHPKRVWRVLAAGLNGVSSAVRKTLSAGLKGLLQVGSGWCPQRVCMTLTASSDCTCNVFCFARSESGGYPLPVRGRMQQVWGYRCGSGKCKQRVWKVPAAV